jgi:predicted nuclease with TOPRIM domain
VDIDDIPDGDENFSSSEVEDLKQRLNTLEKKLTEDLNQAVSDKEQLAKDLEELKAEFEILKQTLPNLSKRGWYKAVLSKLFIWGSKQENQKLVQAATEYGKGLIENVKDHINS